MTTIAWPLVALVAVVLTFVLMWRYLDGRVSYRRVCEEHERAMNVLVSTHRTERAELEVAYAALVKRFDGYDKRLDDYDKRWAVHQHLHEMGG